MRDIRKLGGVPLLIALALSSASCRDEADPLILDGSYLATEAFLGATELVSAGYTVAFHFTFGITPNFQAVLVPPDTIVSAGLARVGFFDIVGIRVAFYDSNFQLQGLADVEQTGNVVDLEFGTTPMLVSAARLVGYSGPQPPALIALGAQQATSLSLTSPGGEVIELIGAGGSATLTFSDLGYALRIDAPAGTLGEQAMVLDYPGAFATVGPTLLLQTAFGCQFFGARFQLPAGGIVFDGGACNVAGQVRRVAAVFQPQ